MAQCGGALRGAARWGRAEHAGAAGEAPRLLAWTARLLAGDCLASIVEVGSCVTIYLWCQIVVLALYFFLLNTYSSI